MVVVACVAVALLACAAALPLRSRWEDGEEFVLTLPAGAPQASPGDTVRLRAVAEDGTALEDDVVVARARGDWLAVRHCPR
jgi:hypothetical protein